jgi:hypothetical protein
MVRKARALVHIRRLPCAPRRPERPLPFILPASMPPTPDALCEAAILALLAARGPGRSICPSEAARRVAGDRDGEWRRLMPVVRAAADRLRAQGAIEITQRGRVLASTRAARGPIRLRLVAAGQVRSRGMSS